MKILAVDTATEACSAALYSDGNISDAFELAPRQHTQLILPMIDRLLEQQALKMADLDALAFGRGPGSFTGVRIATGIVQGLAFALDKPVIGVSTLASIAQSSCDEYRTTIENSKDLKVLAAIDARMGGVYWACYQLDEQGFMRLLGQEHVSPPEDIHLQAGDWIIAGSACEPYAQIIAEQNKVQFKAELADMLPQAKSMVKLASDAFAKGECVSAEQALPVYLRDDVAKKAKTPA